MFDLLVLLSRYLFLFYILGFLSQGFFFVMSERGHIYIDSHGAIRLQRIMIVMLHITGYLILAYRTDTHDFDPTVIINGGLALGFFVAGWVLTGLVYRNSCPLMWNCVFFLMDTGIITLQRISHQTAVKQLMWFFVGFGLMLLIPLFFKIIPRFEKLEIIYLAAGFGFLMLPFFIGLTQYGATRWVDISGFSFQPSEIVKFLLVFYLASVFRKKQTIVSLMIPGGAAAAMVAVLVAQRSLGDGLIFFMTFMVMLYIATGNHWLFAGGVGAASAASVLAHRFFAHVRVRVSAWSDPFADITGTGYQISQSLFAIGTWGPLGSGLTRGTPMAIPIVDSDFIFAAICEEFGGLYGIGLIIVVLVIFYRGIHIALRAERRYYSLLAAGFASILAFQNFLILGGVIKLIPLTGITLPFVSYGGSSVAVSLLMIGILQWIFAYYQEEIEEAEADE